MHNNTPLFTLVRPPRYQGTMWWASHQTAGIVQPGNAHPQSRTASALRIDGVKNRDARPRSRTSPREPSTTGIIDASHASLRTVLAETGLPNIGWAGPVSSPASSL